MNTDDKIYNLNASEFSSSWRIFLPPIFISLICIFIGYYSNFLVFHTLTELFSVCIGFTALTVAATSSQFTSNQFVVYISIALGWCACLDIAHIFVYKGFNILSISGGNTSTQLWISARFLQALAYILAPLFVKYKVRLGFVNLMFALLIVGILSAVFTNTFPETYIENYGVTAFKTICEWGIITILLIALVLFWRNKMMFDTGILVYLSMSIIAMMMSDLSLTIYKNLYGIENGIGHILKIFSFWFIYIGLVVTTLRQPFSMLSQANHEIDHYVVLLKAAIKDIFLAVSKMVEYRDPYTSGHEHRVGLIAKAIGRELGWSEERCAMLELMRLVHDIGKISIPAEILSKPTKLSSIEMELIKGHAQIGYEIIKDIKFNPQVAEVIHQHHERLDGSGYPRGLKDQEILPETRIISVADVLEAMSSHRPYRPALGIERAIEEIIRGRGIQYDAEVVDAALKVLKENGNKLPIFSDENRIFERVSL